LQNLLEWDVTVPFLEAILAFGSGIGWNGVIPRKRIFARDAERPRPPKSSERGGTECDGKEKEKIALRVSPSLPILTFLSTPHGRHLHPARSPPPPPASAPELAPTPAAPPPVAPTPAPRPSPTHAAAGSSGSRRDRRAGAAGTDGTEAPTPAVGDFEGELLEFVHNMC
jgi:hypothetical protein